MLYVTHITETRHSSKIKVLCNLRRSIFLSAQDEYVMLMVQNYYNPIQKFKIILFSAGIDTFIIHSFIIKNTFPFTSVPVRVGVILLVKQTETSIVKSHDRKPQREFSRLDARPQPGEPAASEASEQKNRNRFRTGKVRTRWWR